MTAIALAVLTFACAVVAAWLGTVVRTFLPAAHLTKESQDVIRLGMGLVATMTALLLGLVTAAAKGSFDAQDVALKNAAAGILTLDGLLSRYGADAQHARVSLKQSLAAAIEARWPQSGVRTRPALDSPARPPAEAIEDQILQLVPQTDTQRWLKAESLKLTEEVLRTRWRLLGSAGGAVPRVFLAVVICWLALTFASFGLSAPRNATVMTVFVMAALSVAAAVYLILELDGPLDGVIQISSEPMRHALAHLGR